MTKISIKDRPIVIKTLQAYVWNLRVVNSSPPALSCYFILVLSTSRYQYRPTVSSYLGELNNGYLEQIIKLPGLQIGILIIAFQYNLQRRKCRLSSHCPNQQSQLDRTLDTYISKVGTMGTISYPGENLRTRGFFSEIHSLLTRIRIFSEIHALLRPEIHALLTRIRIFKRNSHTFDENRTI